MTASTSRSPARSSTASASRPGSMTMTSSSSPISQTLIPGPSAAAGDDTWSIRALIRALPSAVGGGGPLLYPAAQGAEQGQGGEVGSGQGTAADTQVDRYPALLGPVDVLQVKQ